MPEETRKMDVAIRERILKNALDKLADEIDALLARITALEQERDELQRQLDRLYEQRQSGAQRG